MIQKTKYAAVLGATSHGERPTPVYAGRIKKAVQLYKSGTVEKLIFTGGPGKPSQAEVGRMEAIAAGVPDTAILIENHSQNTLENLYYTQKLLPSHPIGPLLIVSDPFHLKRAMLLADSLKINAQPAPTEHSAFQSWRTKIQFLIRETMAYSYYRMQQLTGLLERKIKKLKTPSTR